MILGLKNELGMSAKQIVFAHLCWAGLPPAHMSYLRATQAEADLDNGSSSAVGAEMSQGRRGTFPGDASAKRALAA